MFCRWLRALRDDLWKYDVKANVWSKVRSEKQNTGSTKSQPPKLGENVRLLQC